MTIYTIGVYGNTEDEFRVNGTNVVERSVKGVFKDALSSRKDAKLYYYRFNPDIPGDDHPGTFPSVDLWFFFETLMSCRRPFTGRHYDLARQMADYWVNFIKTGDPNGIGSDGLELPTWGAYDSTADESMIFDMRGAFPEHEDSAFKHFLIDHIS